MLLLTSKKGKNESDTFQEQDTVCMRVPSL